MYLLLTESTDYLRWKLFRLIGKNWLFQDEKEIFFEKLRATFRFEVPAEWKKMVKSS